MVEGEGAEDPRHPPQQYDQRGRPVNPDTKRINREIVRSHNEVMLVIGVAEPENPNKSPEAESQRKHDAYEEEIGRQLDSHAKRCIEMVGLFGIHGLRQRILVRTVLPSILAATDSCRFIANIHKSRTGTSGSEKMNSPGKEMSSLEQPLASLPIT